MLKLKLFPVSCILDEQLKVEKLYLEMLLTIFLLCMERNLATIYELKSNLTDDKSKIEVVKLVYSLAASGNERITSLPDKLKEMNLPFDGNSEPETCYLDNPLVPSFLYIFGFLLGDGSFFIRIRQTSAGT